MPHAVTASEGIIGQQRTSATDCGRATATDVQRHHVDDEVLPERPPISPITPKQPPPDLDNLPEVGVFSLDGAADQRQKATPHRPSRMAAAAPLTSPRKAEPQSYWTTPDGVVHSGHALTDHPADTRPILQEQEPEYISRPPSLPLDFESNPDAAALRAAISVLQVQQQKSRKDIQTLQQLKEAASKDPAGFVDEMRSGRLNPPALPRDPLAATLAAGDESDEERDVVEAVDAVARNKEASLNGTSGAAAQSNPKLPTMPAPQNVVRCPPINWSKYHIVGEPLDKMHEDQRRRPNPGEPWRHTPREAQVVAPFSPWRDRPVGGSGNSSPQAFHGAGQQQQTGVQTRKGSGKHA